MVAIARSTVASELCVAAGKPSLNRYSPVISLSSWPPLRSTRGVNRVVGFGNMPLPLDNGLIVHLQQRTITAAEPAFEVGDSVRIISGGFAELDAIFMAMEGEQRVILLLNMLNCQQQISVPLVSIVKN